MRKARYLLQTACVICSFALATPSAVHGQDQLPRDNSQEFADYYHAPAYRESESHPLRVIAYVFHPIGWVLRELIFRPLSYFASSTPETRMVMGYREPHDIYKPSCFNRGDEVPDCRQVLPFNYDQSGNGQGLRRPIS